MFQLKAEDERRKDEGGGCDFRDAAVGWGGFSVREVSEEEAGGDVSGCRRQRRR